uniref:katanin p80 WD40 repeat-containing subunit B1 isoform X1 n=1 Tax=Ciona intestinalis TaxID=7719 RepID=UPI000180BFEE|nr:katanin p80 WD40 repeat-containing subunit B1 isoform X1 [Ciona intestinalis]|eukprot:XP_002128767.1 katanin p80 WD40 repeat-containing subunit B1 isoform X1 [Ciona intestinalis]
MASSTKTTWKLQEFVGHGSVVTSATLGKKSGRVMATGGEDGKVNMWHVGSPNCIMTLSPLTSAVETLQFNSSEEFVCAGSRSGALRIWNLSASKVVRQLTGHKAAVRSVDFHSYGDFVTSGSDDHKVRMWDIRRKGCIFTYKGHEDSVNCVQFSPDGRWIGSVSNDKTCKLWDITAGKLLHELNDHSAGVTCLTFHPRELLLATGSTDRTTNIYDVERFKLLSTSPLEANGIRKIMFSESGDQIYTASQDMFKTYTYDPMCYHLDSVIVKWGKPADITISGEKLMGCSFYQNIVYVHIIDLKTLQTSPTHESESIKFEAKPNQPSSRSHSNVTTRPHTTCGVPAKFPPNPPQVVQCNNNNSESTFKQINPQAKDEIFKPTSTLARSPDKDNNATKDQTKDKTNPTNTTNLHENQRKLNIDETPASNVQPTAQEPKKPNNAVTNTPDVTPAPHAQHNNEPSTILNWDKLQSCDQNIPEKPGACNLLTNNDSKKIFQQKPNALPTKSASDLGISTVIPSDRQDPIGLDMNAFLPAKKDKPSMFCATKTDHEVVTTITKGVSSMRMVLTNRHKNLEIVRALWTTGDVMTSINSAVKMDDQALIVDLLNVLTLKPSLWTLDLCVVMLPQIKSLISSKYETYVSVGCSALKLILKNFSQVIRSNLKTPPTVVDISREERHKKSKSCYSYLADIRVLLDSKQQTAGKIGSQFRELKILISTLE